MSMLNFNAEEVEPAGDFTPVPAGWYPVLITESEMKETKARTGHYLEMKAKIIEGEYMNRLFFIRLNIDNPNDVAVKIAQEQLSAICHAVNVLQVSDSTQLHGLPFEIKVVVKAADGEYDASNEVKGFRALEGAGGVSQGANPAGADPGWAEKKPAPAKKKPAPKKEAAQPVLEMIDTEYSYEEWKETGRTDADLVEEGLAKWVEAKKPAPKKPAPKKAPPAKKSQPSASAADTGSGQEEFADGADGDLPPWMK